MKEAKQALACIAAAYLLIGALIALGNGIGLAMCDDQPCSGFALQSGDGR